MNRQQLLEFDSACRRSLAEADTWLDRFLDGGGCMTKGDLPGGLGKPAHLPQRTSDLLDDELLSQDEQKRTLRQLLLAAGAGPEVERLRIEGLPGEGSSVKVDEEAWARFDGTAEDEALAAAVEPEPDRQALVCLRLLQANANTRDHAWVILVASRRLVHLLSEYPALMHPRIVWDARKLSVAGTARQQRSKSFPNEFEPAPMAHIIINTNQARLPSLELGVSPAAYRTFALHPAVSAGISAEAPRLVTMETKVGLVTWGRTIGEMLLDSDVIRGTCLGNLLRMDRMRRAEGLSSMLVGNQQTVEGYERAVALAFHARWMYSGGNDWQSPLAGDKLVHELRQDARFHQSTLKRTFTHLPKVFSDNCPSIEASTVSAQSRFERMLGSLVEAGLLSDELAGSAFARRLALPAEGEDDELGGHRAGSMFVVLLSGATFEEAHYLLQRWADEGNSLDAMHASIHAHLPNSPWHEAAAILKTQHDMNLHIEAGPAIVGSGSAAAHRMRRRHGL